MTSVKEKRVSKPATASSTPTTRTSNAASATVAKLRALHNGRTDRGEEQKILALLTQAPADELNEVLRILSAPELHQLLGDVDNRWVGPDNRAALLSLFSKDRLPELKVDSRAKVISALQQGATTGGDEQAIRDIFLGTTGRDLSRLKNLIDQGGDHRDLQQLLFHDLDDRKLTESLLAHFKRNGAPNGQVKVLSDIDDTFYANLKDERFPKKTVYPGVRAFYAELDQGGGAAPDDQGDLVFLSARPYDRVGFVEELSLEGLARKGVTQATVLSGDFAHLLGNTQIAEKKFTNWQQLRQLYPEYGSVFTGDSGQGDAIFGLRALAADPEGMKAVFIHNVTALSARERSDFAQKGVFVFDTYVGAATGAFELGLITRAGANRVAAAAQRELNDIPFKSKEQAAQRQAELDRDVKAMKVALQAQR